MNLLYMGSHICSEATFKRLLLLGDILSFTDRPSVTFKSWGTVGLASPLRSLTQAFQDTPIELRVLAPPSGPVDSMYMAYINADLASPDFRATFLRGLRESEAFASFVLQLSGDYGGFTGSDIRRALLDDITLSEADLGDPRDYEGGPMEIAEHKGRIITLGSIMADVSISLTSAMLASAETDATPLADDAHMAQLFGLRVSSGAYVKNGSYIASGLGLAIAHAVIPDQALQQLNLREIVEYRKRAAKPYKAWLTELDALAASLYDEPSEDLPAKVSSLITANVMPRVVEYKNEMRDIAEALYGDAIKRALAGAAAIPTLSVALGARLSVDSALMEFAGWLGTTVAPMIVDYIRAHRRLERKHSIAYLMKLTKG
jgi:hypothetical protein